jgi:hypothetical protein
MKKNSTHNIKETGFKIPEEYFNSLEDAILGHIKINEASEGKGFVIPENYLNNIENTIIDRILEEKSVKVISIFSKKQIVYISSIAAAILLLFSLTINKLNSNPWHNLDTETVENYMLTENIIETYEIASLIPEENLVEADFVQFNFKKENVENYLLNHMDVEDLIAE